MPDPALHSPFPTREAVRMTSVRELKSVIGASPLIRIAGDGTAGKSPFTFAAANDATVSTAPDVINRPAAKRRQPEGPIGSWRAYHARLPVATAKPATS